MDVVKRHVKTISAAVFAIIANAVYDLLTGTAPIPTTRDEWLRYGLSALLAGLGAYGPRNAQTKGQVATAVEKDLSVDAAVDVANVALDRLPVAVQENIARARARGVS